MNKREKGFTLIELLIVVAIIAIAALVKSANMSDRLRRIDPEGRAILRRRAALRPALRRGIAPPGQRGFQWFRPREQRRFCP
jgi:prepilin-type N-terminal cleavage/methylation domain-containing protein